MFHLPFLDIQFNQVTLYTKDGEIFEYDLHAEELTQFLETEVFICINRPYLSEKYHLNLTNGADLLELFNFIFPTQSIAPNLKNMCAFFKLGDPHLPFSIHLIIKKCLENYKKPSDSKKKVPDLDKKASDLGKKFKGKLLNLLHIVGWKWAKFLISELKIAEESINLNGIFSALLSNLEAWEENPAYPEKQFIPITKNESAQTLERFLKHKTSHEIRDSQTSYASDITKIFEGNTHQAIFVEAETGTGKTLGYLAPAIAWSLKNNTPVWISTFTKNLQNQIISEIKTLPQEHLKTVVRKGRENYLCLLNLEELAKINAQTPEHIFSLIMIINWINECDSGDIKGSDFPSWMIQIIGEQYFLSITDRQGECIYSACPHFSKCFIEKNIQASKHADLIIANHALTLSHQIFSDLNDQTQPSHIIFDESHHLFSTADQSFSTHLSGWSMAEIRKWVQGQSSNFSLIRSRRRGLKKRLQEFIDEDKTLSTHVHQLIKATHFLPTDHWSDTLKNKSSKNISELFLQNLYDHITQHEVNIHENYNTEIPLAFDALKPNFIEASVTLDQHFKQLYKSAKALDKYLNDKLKKESGDLKTALKNKLLAVQKSLTKKLISPLMGWQEILASIITKTSDKAFIDWIEISQSDSGYFDLGIHRRWEDPMDPFHKCFEISTKGIAFTSATLSDSKKLAEQSQAHPDIFQTGFEHFKTSHKTEYAFHSSPFDYSKQAKIIIVTDIDKRDINQTSAAYLALIKAMRGSTLGIFTAIQRLQSTYYNIIPDLMQDEITCYAQHVDPIHPAALIELFKNDPNACLLGTDAIRDGIDIPGDDLKCIIFDRVPWARPTHLHKQRRKIASKSHYDDALTRFKLKQAFGRLIRTKKDSGIFILLDSQIPSRILKAFPEDIQIEKMPLKSAVDACKTLVTSTIVGERIRSSAG